MLACKNGHVDSVRELLLAGAKVNHQKIVSFTLTFNLKCSSFFFVSLIKDNIAALHVASFAGYTDIVHSLMLSKADVNLKDEVSVS